MYAFDGDTLKDVFPTFNNFAVNDIVATFPAMYTQSGNLTGELATVYIVKSGDTSSYVCSEIAKAEASSSISSINIDIPAFTSIKTMCLGTLFKPAVRFY